MNTIRAYRMVIFIGVLFTLNALASTIIAAFMNVEWEMLSKTSKFVLVWLIIQNWTGTMLAFMNKTLRRLESGKPPIDTGETAAPFPGYSQFKKEATVTTETKPTGPPPIKA